MAARGPPTIPGWRLVPLASISEIELKMFRKSLHSPHHGRHLGLLASAASTACVVMLACSNDGSIGGGGSGGDRPGGGAMNGGSSSAGARVSGGSTGLGAGSGGASSLGGSAAGGSSSQGGSESALGGSGNRGGASFGSGGKSMGGAANGGASGSGATGAGRGGAAGAGTGGKASAGTGGTAAKGGAGSGGTGGKGGASGTGGTGKGGAGTAGASTGGGGAGSSSVGCTSAESGYRLVWSDEFDGPAGSAVDKGKWTFDVGGTGWGNGELEYYTSGTDNAALDGAGNLIITAKKESMSGMNYTSARIKTQGLASFTYGRIEGRIKIPRGQGIWPAFWMLGSDISSKSWPGCGEIDVMENVGKEPNIIHGTIHGPDYYAEDGPTGQYTLPSPVADDFHVFAVEWEANAIRWYVDQTLYSTKTTADIPPSAAWVFSHPFFLILNVAVGGGWPGNPDNTTSFPQQMVVDYVRVCQK